MATIVVTISGSGPLGLKLVAFHGAEENLCAKVASVKPNSNAFKAKIFPGALICAVNGVAVEGLRYNEVLTKIKEASQSRPFDLTLKRPKKRASFASVAESENSNIGITSTAVENKQKNTESSDKAETASSTSNDIPEDATSADSSATKEIVSTGGEAKKIISPGRENKNVKSINNETPGDTAIGGAQEALASLEKQIVTLKLQLENQTNATTNLSKKFIKEKRELQEKNKLLDKQVQSAKDEVQANLITLEEVKVALNSEISSLRAQLEEEKQKCDVLEANISKENDSRSDDNAKLMEAMENKYETQKTEMHEQIENTRIELKELAEQNAKLRENMDALRAENKEIIDKHNGKIEKMVEKHNIDMASLQQNVAKLSDEKMKLTQKFSQDKAEQAKASEDASKISESHLEEIRVLKQCIVDLKIDRDKALNDEKARQEKTTQEYRECIIRVSEAQAQEMRKLQERINSKILSQHQKLKHIAVHQMKSLGMERSLAESELSRTKKKLQVAQQYEFECTELKLELEASRNSVTEKGDDIENARKQIVNLSSTLEKSKADLRKISLELAQAKEDAAGFKSTLQKRKSSPSLSTKKKSSLHVRDKKTGDDHVAIIAKLKQHAEKQHAEILKMKSQITKEWNLRKEMEATHQLSKRNILAEQKRLVSDQKRVLSRIRNSESSVQRSLDEAKEHFRKEKAHLTEVIKALVRSKQNLQLKYDVVLKKLSLQSISSRKSKVKKQGQQRR